MLAPAFTGSTTTATSSRRSSTSSISLPFATPPTSPKSSSSRIPKPSSSSSLGSARVHGGKPRSRSASADTSNGSSTVYRPDRVVLQSVSPSPSSSSTSTSTGPRPPLPTSRSEGKEQLTSLAAAPSSIHALVPQEPTAGVGVHGLAPVAGAAGISKMLTAGPSGDSSSSTYSPPQETGKWNPSSSPTPSIGMQRTSSVDGSSLTTTMSGSGPRRQRSASSLPRRTIVSTRAPVPAFPQGDIHPRDTSTVIVSQATPLRSRPGPSPNSVSSSSPHLESSSSSSTTPHRTPRQQQRSRVTTPLPSQTSSISTPSGHGTNTRGNAGDRAPHANGVTRHQSTTPRPSTPASRAASPESSLAPSRGKQRLTQSQSQLQAQGSQRRIRREPSSPSRIDSSAQRNSPSAKSTTPVASKSRIPRREDLSQSRLMKASREATESSLNAVALLQTRAGPALHGFGNNSSFNHSTSPQPSELQGRSGSSSRQSNKQPKPPQSSPPRKSAGLTIPAPPPLMLPVSNRRLSVQSGAPNSTPPVPAKSPLRALNSAGITSKRQSRAVTTSDAPSLPPMPPPPEGLSPATEPATPSALPAFPAFHAPSATPPQVYSTTSPEEACTPRPSVVASRNSYSPESSAATLASLSVADNAVSLNSGPPSDSGIQPPREHAQDDGRAAAAASVTSFPSSPDQTSRDAGSVAATHGHSDHHHSRGGVLFAETLSETVNAYGHQLPSGGAHETLSASPEPVKGRLSDSTASSSAPVTPSASIPSRAMQFGDSHPDSEIETASSSRDFLSTYSPESTPLSAPASSVNLWAAGARYDSPPEETGTGLPMRRGSDQQEMLVDGTFWRGQKRHSTLQTPAQLDEDNPTTPLSSKFVDKDLPATPKTPPQRSGQHPTMRSPSMPQIGPNRVPNGSTPEVEARLSSPPDLPRSNTAPSDASLHPPTAFPQREMTTWRKSMLIASAPGTRSPSFNQMSHRSHLLREIANTERAHATDLALIRDAYIGQFLRPDSGVQHGSEASTPPMDSLRHSRRSSAFGLPIEELGWRTSGHQGDAPRRTSSHQGDSGLRTSGYEGTPWRTSGHERRTSVADPGWSNTWNGIMSQAVKSPRDNGGSAVDLNYSSSGAAWSSTSLSPSPNVPSTPSSMNGAARFGLVRPLSQADIKAVFLNISALAAVSDALATGFEAALGNGDDESPTPGGEGASDRLGEAFLKALPGLRPLYTYYCSRQAQARARLQELQNDPSYSAHLNECWDKVKAHTHAWNLDSMLIKPVQRVTKYPLLFEDLFSCTTRTHPDYFAIRQAAEGARSLALEVDEAKRRKDVISSVMSGRPSAMSGRSSSSINMVKEPKRGGGGRLLGRFKKEKASPSGHDQSAVLYITPYAESQLKDLGKRLSDCERNVRRLLVELPDWCEATRLLLRQKMEINIYFLKWYALGRRVTNDNRIEKVARFSGVLDNILTGVWEDMNQTVRNSIVVNLEKLHETTKNPLAIIAKLLEKSDVYSRYVGMRQAKKSIDKILLQEVSEYVTVHSQLLEELPAFLEGFTRIYEMSLGAFVTAQSKYFETLRDTLALFSAQFLTEPTEMAMVGDTIKEVRMDVSTLRGIHRAWLERWREPNNVMKSLQITGGEGSFDTQMRADNLNAGHANRTSAGSSGSAPSSRRFRSSSRPHSHRHTPSYDARSSTLQTTPSATASAHSSLEQSSNPRRRSVSLNVETTPGSTGPELRPDSGSIFGSLIRRASNRDRRRESSSSLFDSRGGSGSSSSNPSVRSTMIKRSSMRVNSASARSSATHSQSEDNERHSFGLPRIPMTDTKFVFDNLSLGNEKNEATYVAVPPVTYQQQDMGLSALGLGDTTPPTDVYYLKSPQPDGYFVQQPHEPSGDDVTPEMYIKPMGVEEPDAGETWREEQVLYSCCAVADFDPVELGEPRFNGLRFLPLLAGDMVDIFHEIGRIAELPGFPYSRAGVDNDGAVIARSESGRIGVAMCSFLEPVRS